MFKKTAGEEEDGEDEEQNNMRQYLRKLEGQQLSDYVDRYT